ncbi:hypothetical protein [Flavobacterium sp.]|uniref:hypothetical protein n=1 Tax=Flavobacterium sp. TaxID=239 RepID=UPI0037504DD2
MKFKLLLFVALFTISLNAQNISSEIVYLKSLKAPKILIDEASRSYKVTVTSPYNLTAEDVIQKSKDDFKKDVANHDNVVKNSETEFQQKLKDYDKEVVDSKEKFAQESAEFKKLTLFERLTMTEQGKNPRMYTPTKPVYYKPQPPVYREPNLNEYIIVNNSVLSTQINIKGFNKESNYVDINVDIKDVKFQDNAGQSFANQPTKLVVKVNGVEKINKTFFQDFEMISSSPTNNINKPLEEKNHLNKVIAFLNTYLDDNFAFQTLNTAVSIKSVKNKGKYDDLEKADIYITTNIKKMQPDNPAINAAATAGLQKGIDIWLSTLTKVEYKNTKADLNSKIAKFIYFNLINLNLAMNKKTEAEKYLNELQENLVDIKLSYEDEVELKNIESRIYTVK